MVAITLNGRRRELPTGWPAVGPAAWPMLRAIAEHPTGPGKLEALRLLLGVSRREFGRIASGDLAELSAATPWLTVSPISAALRPRLRVGLRWYDWAAEDFDDGTCLTYALADEYFVDAIEADGAAALTAARHLVAAVVTPATWRRVPSESRERVEARARRFGGLHPAWLLQGIMYWAGVRAGMDRRYGEYLFRPFALDGGRAAAVPSFGWWSSFQDVAEGRVFGTLDDVYRANFHEVAQWMLRKEAARRAQLLDYEKAKMKSR